MQKWVSLHQKPLKVNFIGVWVQQTSPGFANEKKVDHLTIILEVRLLFYGLLSRLLFITLMETFVIDVGYSYTQNRTNYSKSTVQ
jgi:hypothetical protein